VAEMHTDGVVQTVEATPVAGATDETGAPIVEPVIASASSVSDDVQPAPWPTNGPALAGAVAAGLMAVAAAALLVRRSGGRAEPPLERGESLALSVRPRKAVRSYLRSAGLWELDRRATRFTVTDRRLLVEEGIVRRAVTAVPLSVLQQVVVRTGPWQGWVDVSFPTASGRGVERMGPFRSPVAREFAATIGRRGGVVVDEVVDA
jgi:Bacterial PH domain